MKNFHKTVLAVMCVVLSLCFCLSTGCKKHDDDKGVEVQIVDDNYRNYYEIFVRSYYDTNNDGYGDLNGVTQKLDYIKEMGFNGIWFMPVCKSGTYHKYDVQDYYTIDKEYGTNDDFKNLVTEAHLRGINIIVDLVVNHSSNEHQWFKEATTALKNGTESKYINYYNFSKTANTGYERVAGTDYYYECRFSNNMPDLNLDSQDVRKEIEDIIEFWLTEMGVDGFRLDACTSYYTGNVAKNVEFLSYINKTVKNVKADAYIVGEAWEGTDGQIRQYYNSGIDSCFLFTASQGGGTIKSVFSSVRNNPGEYFTDILLNYQKVYNIGSLAPFLGNHDTARAAKFLYADTVKMAAGLLSVMNGNTFVYYGEEIGMINASDADPTKRIAMKWEDKNVYTGLTYMPPEGVTVNKDSYIYPSVLTQQSDENSILNYYKKAMWMRHRNPEIARGTIEKLLVTDKYVSAFSKTWKGSKIVVLINLSDM
jgi:glycosidase